MSLIAGYINKEGKYSTDTIRSKVDSFSCISNENLKMYNTHILPIKYGHIILSHKADYPIQNDVVKDSHKNVLMTLGFFCFSKSTDNYQKVFDRCVHETPAILEKCEGEFIAVFFDSLAGKTHIVNDRFASRPLYVLADKKVVYFSSNLAFLLHFVSGKPEADILGWLQFFCFNVPFGTRTTFKNIKRLKPATHLILSHDRVTDRRYWLAKQDEHEDLCPDEHARKTFDAFKRGAEFRANLVDKGVLALSGGLDSRLVAGGLPENHGFSAFTFINSTKDENTIEVEAAKEVSKILSLEHHIEKMPSDSISSVAKDVIWLTGGLIPLTGPAKTMSYIKHIKSKGFSFLLGGGPGNLIAGPMMPELPFCVHPETIEEGTRSYYNMRIYGRDDNESIMKRLIKKDTLKEYYQATIDSFFESFDSVNGPTLAHKIRIWTLGNRQPAFTFTSPIHNHPDLTEAFCHLDYEFCDLMLKVPFEWIYKRNFYEYMIFKNLEHLQGVKDANTGRTLSGEIKQYQTDIPARSQSDYKEFIKRLAKRNKLTMQCYIKARNFKERLRRPRQDYNILPNFHYTLYKQDKALFTDLTDILHSVPGLKDILDIEGCNKFLDAFDEGKLVTKSYREETKLLGSLATLCYSFKYFNL